MPRTVTAVASIPRARRFAAVHASGACQHAARGARPAVHACWVADTRMQSLTLFQHVVVCVTASIKNSRENVPMRAAFLPVQRAWCARAYRFRAGVATLVLAMGAASAVQAQTPPAASEAALHRAEQREHRCQRGERHRRAGGLPVRSVALGRPQLRPERVLPAQDHDHTAAPRPHLRLRGALWRHLPDGQPAPASHLPGFLGQALGRYRFAVLALHRAGQARQQ